jgi:hypothetical protein
MLHATDPSTAAATGELTSSDHEKTSPLLQASTAVKYVNDPDQIESADVEVLRKLLTTHVRQERFCEGYLAAMFENGHILALLRRLKQIAARSQRLRYRLPVSAVRSLTPILDVSTFHHLLFSRTFFVLP